MCRIHQSEENFMCTDNVKRYLCPNCVQRHKIYKSAGDDDRLLNDQMKLQTIDNPIGQVFSKENSLDPSIESRLQQATDKFSETFTKDQYGYLVFRIKDGEDHYKIKLQTDEQITFTKADLENKIKQDIQEKNILYEEYQVTKAGEIIEVKNSKIIKKFRPMFIDVNKLEIYQLLIDLPLLLTETKEFSLLLESLVHFTQENMKEKYCDEKLFDLNMKLYEEHLQKLKKFDKVFNWGFSIEDEHQAWFEANRRKNSLKKIKISNDNALENWFFDEFTIIQENLSNKKSIFFPIFWNQKYYQDKNNENVNGDQIVDSIKNQSKKPQIESNDCLWFFIEPEKEGDHFSISIINTSSLFSSLFPTCKGKYKNPLYKKYSSENANQNDDIGTMNHLKYSNIDRNLITQITIGLLVMEIVPKQRDPNSNNFSMKLPSATDILSITTKLAIKGGKFYNTEESISNNMFDGRCILDYQLLEGHTIHILERILFLLNNDSTVLLDKSKQTQESIYPLQTNLSITKSFLLYEKFKFGDQIHKRLKISRLLSILQSIYKNISTYNGELLCYVCQSIFHSSEKFSFIFQNNKNKEIESIKSFLDEILHVSNISRIKLDSIQKSLKNQQIITLPYLIEYHEIPTCKNKEEYKFLNRNESSIIPNHLQLNELREKILNGYFNYNNVNEFVNLWHKWFSDLQYSISCNKTTQKLILQNMVECLPEFNDQYWDSLDDLSLFENWSIIINKIIQFISGRLFKRFGISLENFELFQKRGLYPDEFWNLLKCSAILMKISEKYYPLYVSSTDANCIIYSNNSKLFSMIFREVLFNQLGL